MEHPGTTIFEEETDPVRERIDKITQSATAESFSMFGNSTPIRKGFIPSTVDLRVNAVTNPLRIDDMDVYGTIDDKRRHFIELFGSSIDEHKASILATQSVIFDYLGVGGSSTKREDVYFEDHWNKDFVSISEFKGENAAACLERAGLAQNLLAFLGEDTELVGGECALIEGIKEFHAYNIVKKDDGYYLFDPTNPSLGEVNEQGHLEAYAVAEYPISNEEYQQLLEGKPINVIHKPLVKDQDGKYKKDEEGSVLRTYSIFVKQNPAG